MSIQLLVSVRNPQEAMVAADSGADIVDVKEPRDGSLGYAGSETIRAIADAVGGRCPVSAALGECTDWLSETELLPSEQELPPSMSYAKLGLSGMVDGISATSKGSWATAWSNVRSRLVIEGSQTQWVAVAYADSSRCGAPAPEVVLKAAGGCAGFLIDTWQKGHGTSVDLLTLERLQNLRQQAATQGLFFALAGQLTTEHLRNVQEVGPDILAVRGAVCEQNDRTATISGDRVRQLKEQLAAM